MKLKKTLLLIIITQITITKNSEPHPTTPPKNTFEQVQPDQNFRPWGYVDKDKSLATKGLDFLKAGGSFLHSIAGNTGNTLGQVASFTVRSLGQGFSYLGSAIDESEFQTKESLALTLGYSLAAWIGYKYYHWRNNPQSRSLFTFLIPDWAMRAVGNK